MVLKRLTQFLDENSIKYSVITHSQAFTANETAALAHIPGKEIAKTVIVKADKEFVMTVLPASEMVNFKALKDVLNVPHVTLASETEFTALFPNCEAGAMPPFGNLYNMSVVAARSLSEDKEIAFNAGTHRELIRMQYADFERLVKPRVAEFSVVKKSATEEDVRYGL